MKFSKILLLSLLLVGGVSSCKDTLGWKDLPIIHKHTKPSTTPTSTNSVSATIIGNMGGRSRAFSFTGTNTTDYKLDLSQLKFSSDNKNIPIYLYAFHDENGKRYVSKTIDAKADYDTNAHEFTIKECNISFAYIRRPDPNKPGEFLYDNIPSGTTLTISQNNPIYITGIIGGYKDSRASDTYTNDSDPSHYPMIYMPGASNILYPIGENNGGEIKCSSILGTDKDFVIPVALKLSKLYNSDKNITLKAGNTPNTTSTAGNVSLHSDSKTPAFQLMGNLLAIKITNNTDRKIKKITFQTNAFTRTGIYDMSHCQGNFVNANSSPTTIPVNQVGTTPFHLYWFDNMTASINSNGVATINWQNYLDGITKGPFSETWGSTQPGDKLPDLYQMTYILYDHGAPAKKKTIYGTWVMGRTLYVDESNANKYPEKNNYLCNSLYYNATISDKNDTGLEDLSYYQFESSTSDVSKLYSLPILKKPNGSYVLPITITTTSINGATGSDLIFSQVYYGNDLPQVEGATKGGTKSTNKYYFYNGVVQIYNPTDHPINLRDYFLARVTSTDDTNHPLFVTTYGGISAKNQLDISKALLMPLDFIRFKSGKIQPSNQSQKYEADGVFMNTRPYLVEADMSYFTNFDITSSNGGDPYPEIDQANKFHRYGSTYVPVNLSPVAYPDLHKETNNIGGHNVEDLVIDPGKNIIYTSARPWNFYVKRTTTDNDDDRNGSPVIPYSMKPDTNKPDEHGDEYTGGFINPAVTKNDNIGPGGNPMLKLPEKTCNFVVLINDAFMWDHGFHISTDKYKHTWFVGRGTATTYNNYWSYLDGDKAFYASFNDDPFSYGSCYPASKNTPIESLNLYNQHYNEPGGLGNITKGETNLQPGIMQFQINDILLLIKMEKQTVIKENGDIVIRYTPRIVDVVGGYPFDHLKQFDYSDKTLRFYQNVVNLKPTQSGDVIHLMSYWMVRKTDKPYPRGKNFQELDWNLYTRSLSSQYNMTKDNEKFGKWTADKQKVKYSIIITQ